MELKAWAIPAGIVATAAVLIAIVIGQGAPDEAATAESTSAPRSAAPEFDFSDVERRDPADPLAVGPLDAPVGLVIFSDYQCSFCASWNHDTLPELLPYVESGDLRIEWRDVNVFGEASERAARAAYAAALQERYRDYHEALFANGNHLPESELTEQALTDLASRLGLDTEQFTADMNSATTANEVRRNEQEGRELGVTGTPAFILGGQPIVGAQPTSVFVDAMRTSLAESEG